MHDGKEKSHRNADTFSRAFEAVALIFRADASFVLIFSNDDPDTEQRHLGGLTPCLRYPCFADMYDNPLLSYKNLQEIALS